MKNSIIGKHSKKYDFALREIRKKNADVDKVMEWLKGAVDARDDRAQYALATWYLFGKYVKKNPKKAVELLQRSAEQRNCSAMYDLAVCYEKGRVSKRICAALSNYIFREPFGVMPNPTIK